MQPCCGAPANSTSSRDAATQVCDMEAAPQCSVSNSTSGAPADAPVAGGQQSEWESRPPREWRVSPELPRFDCASPTAAFMSEASDDDGAGTTFEAEPLGAPPPMPDHQDAPHPLRSSC
eukprot:4860530-Pleurochrysis_carterae.AAC.1